MARRILKRISSLSRLKILLGISFIAGLFLTLIISALLPLSSESLTTRSIDQSRHKFFDQTGFRVYKWQQQKLKDAVRIYFENAIAAGEIVGAGVSIVSGDSVILSDGFGKRNINEKDRVDGQTLFRLGSLSKGFTGILAAHLKNEGLLDWEDKVSDYIPEFQLGDRANTDKITLANILSHSAGAPYHSYTNLVEAGLPLTDIAKRFKQVAPISSPGLEYSYQNALFALSEEIIFRASGLEFIESLENRLFNPLEMCSANMEHKSILDTDNVAMPHSRWRKGYRPKRLKNSYYNAVAAGGINANARDMAKWMQFLLGHKPEIMSTSALKEVFIPQIEIKGNSKYYQRWPGHISSYYGFGWRIHKFKEDSTDQEQTIWHHGGSVNSYRNEIAIYPEADLGICVLLNSNSRLARKVIPDLYEIVNKVFDQNSVKPVNGGIATAIPQL